MLTARNPSIGYRGCSHDGLDCKGTFDRAEPPRSLLLLLRSVSVRHAASARLCLCELDRNGAQSCGSRDRICHPEHAAADVRDFRRRVCRRPSDIRYLATIDAGSRLPQSAPKADRSRIRASLPRSLHCICTNSMCYFELVLEKRPLGRMQRIGALSA